MSKAVNFKMPAPKAPSADAWVDQGVESHLKVADAKPSTPAVTKRLTLDMPAELHARLKLACVQRDETMLEVICRFVEAEFPVKS